MTGLSYVVNTMVVEDLATIFPSMGIFIIKVRRSSDRLIFIMGILILVRRHFYNVAATWLRCIMAKSAGCLIPLEVPFKLPLFFRII